MTDNNTQLTTASGYDTKRMIFSEPAAGEIPNSVPAIKYKRINIQTRNEDGTIGELILQTERLFSFGVGENTNPETKKVNGYVMPLVLWNRDNPSQAEKDWTTTFDNIMECCKDHLINNKEEIDKYDLERADLKKLNPLYYKKEKGKVVEGSSPTLYAKLIVSKKLDKIVTMFFNNNGDPIDPMTLLGKHCHVKAAIKIESIFIGSKISMQVKMYECEATLIETGMKRLLKRPTPQPRMISTSSANPMMDSKNDDDDEDENNDDDVGIVDDDDEPTDPDPEPEPVKKKVIRKVKKVVRKSGD